MNDPSVLTFQQRLQQTQLYPPSLLVTLSLPQSSYLDTINLCLSNFVAENKNCSSCLDSQIIENPHLSTAKTSFRKLVRQKRKNSYRYDGNSLKKQHLSHLLLAEFTRAISNLSLEELESFVILTIQHKVKLDNLHSGI